MRVGSPVRQRALCAALETSGPARSGARCRAFRLRNKVCLGYNAFPFRFSRSGVAVRPTPPDRIFVIPRALSAPVRIARYRMPCCVRACRRGPGSGDHTRACTRRPRFSPGAGKAPSRPLPRLVFPHARVVPGSCPSHMSQRRRLTGARLLRVRSAPVLYTKRVPIQISLRRRHGEAAVPPLPLRRLSVVYTPSA